MAHQDRWNKIFTAALKFLREHNTGVFLKTSISFGDLIDHNIIGLDKICLMTDASDDLRIFGEVGRKKHENKVSDFRYSTTMV